MDTQLLEGIVYAFKWQRMIEQGKASSGRELAKVLDVERSHVLRTLRLTQLAPDIIEAIINGRQPNQLSLRQLHRDGFPNEWQAQREQLGFV